MSHEYLQAKLGENYHSFLYRLLFIILAGSTIQLLLIFKSPKIYKNLLDKVFNIEFTVFKQKLTIYFAIIIWVFLLLITALIIKLQLNDYQSHKWNAITTDPHSTSTFYKNKWILESELWMVMIILVEWM